jgi:16S rRNA (guanine966-N2)-methyltransferase|tara:strand:+ start:352 stop:906 length:555 start_codon:yes stop_codon:yes gene_type:complete
MRIISGEIKGKKILEPRDKLTRPLKDLVKESIFNIIKHSNLFKVEIKKSGILDLFSGVGSFGIECLSRGASTVIFFENYEDAVNILKKNISNCNFEEKSIIIEKDVFLDNAFKLITINFEIIFLDPPFQTKIYNLLDKIIKLNLLKKNGVIVIHRHKKEMEKLPENFKILQEKCYGNSKIIFGN